MHRESLSESLMRALVRSLVLLSYLLINLIALSTTDAAAGKKGTTLPQQSSGRQSSSRLEVALPFKLNGYKIGSPAEKNDYPGVESGIDDPDKQKSNASISRYYIDCLSNYNGDIEIYKNWHNGPRKKEVRYIKDTDMLSVIYFIEDKNKQYVYGMVSDGRSLTNGIPILVDSKYWNCNLSK